MEQLHEQWLFLTFVVTLGAAALSVVIHLGCLRAHVFDDLPPRRAGIAGIDVVIAFFVFAVGAVMLGPILKVMGLLVEEPAELTVRQSALQALVSQLIVQLPTAAVIVGLSLFRVRNLRELGLPVRIDFRHFSAGLIALLLATPMVMGLTVIMQIVSVLLNLDVPEVGHGLLGLLMKSDDPLATAIIIASAVILAPILEEIMFRGLLQTAFLESIGWVSRWPAIFGAAFLFAIVHGGIAARQTLPGLFVLGIALGWLYERYNSLWPSIVLHMGFNAVNILLATAM